LKELIDLNLWDDRMKNMIIVYNGSVENVPGIPEDPKAIYKSVGGEFHGRRFWNLPLTVDHSFARVRV